jgi:hypothetical protein
MGEADADLRNIFKEGLSVFSDSNLVGGKAGGFPFIPHTAQSLPEQLQPAAVFSSFRMSLFFFMCLTR